MPSCLRQFLIELSQVMDTSSAQLAQAIKDAMAPNWLDKWGFGVGVAISGLTLIVLIFTLSKVREQVRAANNQTQEMIEQRKLSVTPSLSLSFNGVKLNVPMQSGTKMVEEMTLQPHINNVGNGTAISIRIDDLVINNGNGTEWKFQFATLPHITKGTSLCLCAIEKSVDIFKRPHGKNQWEPYPSNAQDAIEAMTTQVPIKELIKNQNYDVIFHFQDIMGRTLYQKNQVFKMQDDVVKRIHGIVMDERDVDL